MSTRALSDELDDLLERLKQLGALLAEHDVRCTRRLPKDDDLLEKLDQFEALEGVIAAWLEIRGTVRRASAASRSRQSRWG